MTAHRSSPKAHNNAPIPNLLVPLSAPGDEPVLLKRGQLARLLNLSPRSVDNLQKRRVIPYVKITPRLVRFYWPDVIRAVRTFEIRAVGTRRPQHKN
jgi:hypothetical protein